MKYLYTILIAFLCMLASCKKDKPSGSGVLPGPDTCNYTAGGRWMSNPYLLKDLLQQSGMEDMTATHEYIRVWINQPDLWQQWDAAGSFLPFDWRKEPMADGSHAEDENKNSDGLWIYGLISKTTDKPSGKYEVLDERYIPEPGQRGYETIFGSDAAHQRTAPTLSGQLRFFDPISGRFEPLAGVRVIVQDGGRTLQAVTQEDGSFSNPNRILGNTAEIILRFDHPSIEIRTLDFNDLSGILLPNILSMGMITQCSFADLRLEIGPRTTNAQLQASGAAWYAYQQFKKFAQAKGYGIPSRKLNFWAAKDAPINDSYSAPMLRHVGAQQGARELLMQLFGLPASIANPLANLIKNDLPDIYAPYYSNQTNFTPARHIEVLFHEFGHSTHYVKSGNAFWTKYIDHIFQKGGYGDGNDPLSGLVAMSEAWAEDFAKEVLDYFYGKEKYSPELRDANTWRGYPWIPVGVYYDLHDHADNEPFDKVSGFSFKEMYDVFSNDIDAPRKFMEGIIRTYPAKASGQEDNMDILFRHYGY
jgi:hypothetical protein